jgi:hypothetical protein
MRVVVVLRRVHKLIPQTAELVPMLCQSILDIKSAKYFQRLR